MKLITKGFRVEGKNKKYVEEFEQVEIPQPMMESLDHSSAFQGQFDHMLGGQSIGNRNILVITPATNQDIARIVENLQNNEACVIDLEKVAVVDAQRRLDFLSGVICALNGHIKPLDAHKYILTPQGLGVVR
ncbi:MAG: cell division protein SepF [Firmicutes bacterium]|nr:cell division protein SepF [Bacillota bacterium]